ncbi:MAG: trypsin-like peptidase domain-containing protein [Candidatus Harrisonbacteria bacterium]|nr:trypsin-like peptidase domain-containing protein [Candidatus Harrisonbacteria bacterium]
MNARTAIILMALIFTWLISSGQEQNVETNIKVEAATRQAETAALQPADNSPVIISTATEKRSFKNARQIYREAMRYTVAVITEWDDANDFQNPNYPRKGSFCSGIIRTINDKPYVYTLNHCLNNFTNLKNFKISVEFSNGSWQEVEIVGYNEIPLDVALLKFKDEEFKVSASAIIGNSDTLEVGESVVALGHPYGIKNYLSKGIISRLTVTEVPYYNGPGLIGVDVRIMPGNSGGPLLNMRGEVVGLNQRVNVNNPSVLGQFPNIPLAIPINQFEAILPKLLKGGEIKIADIGYHIRNSWELRPEELQEIGVSKNLRRPVVLGPKIAPPIGLPRLWPFSNLREGDVILEYNDKPIKTCEQIARENLTLKPGNRIKVTVLRNGKVIKKEVELKDLKELMGSNSIMILKGLWEIIELKRK